jgi:hypothetical protein
LRGGTIGGTANKRNTINIKKEDMIRGVMSLRMRHRSTEWKMIKKSLSKDSKGGRSGTRVTKTGNTKHLNRSTVVIIGARRRAINLCL